MAGWFLGPRAENRDQFTRLTKQAIDWYSDCREQYYPTDPCYITEDVKASSAYRAEIRDLEEQMEAMFHELSDSIPFFSTRYQVDFRRNKSREQSFKFFPLPSYLLLRAT